MWFSKFVILYCGCSAVFPKMRKWAIAYMAKQTLSEGSFSPAARSADLACGVHRFIKKLNIENGIVVFMEFFATLSKILYFTAATGLLIYGMNCYIMLFLFQRRKTEAKAEREAILAKFKSLPEQDDLPHVTTQLPIYNEYNVVERAIRKICEIDYPKDRHEIQVLDDSNDETCELVDRVVEEFRIKGFDISVLRRKNRQGFKAGALNEAMKTAKGTYLAIFDADFLPEKDFLHKTVLYFLNDEKIGLVQARWGHVNRTHSMLTRAQSIGIDGHFMVEQSARNWNDLFMNFNGTAGLWHRDAIAAGGGWQWDTLTEDMDLSYRVQLAGWKTMYTPDVVVPAEIPEDVTAFKSQQFRWAKGSMQTAIKLLPRLLKAKVPFFKKFQSFFHLTHYCVHPLMLTLALLALPVLLTLETSISPAVFAVLSVLLGLSMVAPSSLYLASQRAAYDDWHKRILCMPMLVTIGVGIAVSNTRAVFEAIIGKESGFVRTPKRGDKEVKKYKVGLPWTGIFEIILGCYCGISLKYYILAEKYLVGPFLAIYSAGFMFIGALTIIHYFGLTDFSLRGNDNDDDDFASVPMEEALEPGA